MFQVANVRSGPWVSPTSLTFSPGDALRTNITITLSSPGPYALLRFAYDPYPQCAILGLANGLPLPAFLVNISSPAAAAVMSSPLAPSPPPPPPPPPAAGAAAAATPAALPPTSHSLTWRGEKYSWMDSDPKPPMGINTWNSFHCNVDELLVMATGRAFLSLGLRDLGWSYINIDDCWQVGRNASGYIIEDPVRFPSGIGALSSYIHSLGLKFGLYTSATADTCQERPGSYEMEAQDSASYCEFQIDYVSVW